MTELENLLINARADIVQLRQENEILRAKDEVTQLFACTLHTQPTSQTMCMGEDVVWKLDQAIARIQKERKTDA